MIGKAARAVEMTTQEDVWTFLGAVGHDLRQLDPAFDSRSYGYQQLSALIRSEPERFETRDRKTKGGPSTVQVRPVG